MVELTTLMVMPLEMDATLTERLRAWLLLCISIRGSVALANWFSSHVVLLSSISNGDALTFALTCRPIPVLVENADAH